MTQGKKQKKYNILVLGNRGMLGAALYDRLINLSMLDCSSIGTVVGMDRDDIDVSVKNSVCSFMLQNIHFDYCINCVAFTDTKAAENTEEGRSTDYLLNALVPKYIAEACKYCGTKFIHISTDYVFSERSCGIRQIPKNTPFTTGDEPYPCNIYGYDKLIGEKNIREVFGVDSDKYCILRTSWIYSEHNNKSFVHKFIKNVVRCVTCGKHSCDMTSNEVSIPTSCQFLIQAILSAIDTNRSGMHHAVPKCDGVSRLEYAREIVRNLNGIMVNHFDLGEFEVNGVERDTYQPEYSAIASTFPELTARWEDSIRDFVRSYGRDIVKWSETEVNTNGNEHRENKSKA